MNQKGKWGESEQYFYDVFLSYDVDSILLVLLCLDQS